MNPRDESEKDVIVIVLVYSRAQWTQSALIPDFELPSGQSFVFVFFPPREGFSV